MDGGDGLDLQEPPEEIPRLYAKAQEGYDIVYTRRSSRPGSRLRAAAGSTYMRLRRFLLRTGHAINAGSLSDPVPKGGQRLPDLARHGSRIPDRARVVGFPARDHRRRPRRALRGPELLHAPPTASGCRGGDFFQTTILLRWIVFLGFFVALAGVLLAAYYFYPYFTSTPLPGYTSLAVLLLLLCGFIIVSMGVIGLYVGKVFEQVKGRPLFLIDRQVVEGNKTGLPPLVTDDVAAERLVLEQASQGAAPPGRVE